LFFRHIRLPAEQTRYRFNFNLHRTQTADSVPCPVDEEKEEFSEKR